MKQLLIFFAALLLAPRTAGYAADTNNRSSVPAKAHANLSPSPETLAEHVELPPRDGLRLWLDASDAAATVVDNGAVTVWKDRVSGRQMVHAGSGRATLMPAAINGRSVVRLDGSCGFTTDAIRERPGPAAIFIVTRRPPEQSSDRRWQRVFSSWAGNAADNQAPSFCLIGGTGGDGAAYEPRVSVLFLAENPLAKIAVGMNASGHTGQSFAGDIGEVLVYDRMFLTFDDSNRIVKYLKRKWQAEAEDKDSGWTRVGGLVDLPQRVTNAYPLSDQENRGGWRLVQELSDEFDAGLDANRWIPYCPWWKGRPPALFSPANVTVSDGMLHLAFRIETVPEMRQHPEYSKYTSAFVHTRQKAHYGYYEVKARPMRSAASSSFWFQADLRDVQESEVGFEIDVFELGGKAAGYDRKYNMNLHGVRKTPGKTTEPFSSGGVWVAPWILADDFHVYGLEWTERTITYYVDGVTVRVVENRAWKYPLHLIFDSEAMFSWLGTPLDEDLPSVFDIDYVRAWIPN